jgi:FkbM family methyltransferase
MNTIKRRGKNFNLAVKLRDEIDESIWAEIFKHGEYRVCEPIIISAQYPIIDVGAHAGFFSLYARDLNQNVLIYAMEPEPKNFIALNTNINGNKLKNIFTLNLALTDKSDKKKLIISEDSHNHKLITKPEKDGKQKTCSVQTICLSDLFKNYNINKISLLKMDVEGEEFKIFKNAKSPELRQIEAIILEYHNNQENNYKKIENILRKNGFGVQIFPSKFEKKLGFIYANNKLIN